MASITGIIITIQKTAQAKESASTAQKPSTEIIPRAKRIVTLSGVEG